MDATVKKRLFLKIAIIVLTIIICDVMMHLMRNERDSVISHPVIARFAPVLGIIGGILFMVYGVIAYRKQQAYTLVTATVTDVFVLSGIEADDPDRITPTLEYEVDGQTYTTTFTEGQEYYAIGDHLDIKYNPADPQQIIDPNPAGPWLLGGFGILVLLASAFATRQTNRPPSTEASSPSTTASA